MTLMGNRKRLAMPTNNGQHFHKMSTWLPNCKPRLKLHMFKIKERNK